MRCESVREELERFRDGDLPPGVLRAIEEHQAACAACRAYEEEDRGLVGVLREAYRDEAAAARGFADALEAATRRATEFRRAGGRLVLFRRTAWGTAAAALLVASALLVFSPGAGRVTVRGLKGRVIRTDSGHRGVATIVRDELLAGNGLEAAPGGEAVLTVGQRAAARLEGDGSIRVVAAGRLRLEKGTAAVHVDGGPLTVETPALELRAEHGTFQVQVEAGPGTGGQEAGMRAGVAVAAGATVAVVTAGSVFFHLRRERAEELRAAEMVRALPGEAAEVRRIDDLERENRSLKEDLAALRSEIAALKAAPAARPPAPGPGAPRGREEREETPEPPQDLPDAGKEEAPDREKLEAQFMDLAKAGFMAWLGPARKGELRSLAKAFKELGAEGVRMLGDILTGEGGLEEKYLAATLLEALEDPAAMPYLERSLQKETDPMLRRFSSHAAAMIAREADIPFLSRVMNDLQMEHGARVNAAFGLARLGNQAGLDYTLEACRSSDPTLRLSVLAGALMLLDHPSVAALARDQLRAEGVDVGMRLLSIQALGRMRDQMALPLLETIVSGNYPPSLQEEARKAIERILGR